MEENNTSLLRIHVDFNTAMADPKERVTISFFFEPELLSMMQNGRRVILFEPDDIQVEAVLEYDIDYERWYAIPDWSTLKEL